MNRAFAVLLFVVVLSSCVPVPVAGEYDYGYPPDSYIATATPIYYEGYPSYYWGGHWYRREGARWHYYHSEPAYLSGWRYRYPRGRWGYWGGYHRRW